MLHVAVARLACYFNARVRYVVQPAMHGHLFCNIDINYNSNMMIASVIQMRWLYMATIQKITTTMVFEIQRVLFRDKTTAHIACGTCENIVRGHYAYLKQSVANGRVWIRYRLYFFSSSRFSRKTSLRRGPVIACSLRLKLLLEWTCVLAK